MFHELTNVATVEDIGALTIPRAVALLEAVQSHRDYSLIQILRHPTEGAPTIECLIVEVECDGVPPNNTIGIQYRERLALCVPSDPKKLIEVLALREDFPILIHQNQGVWGAPASLCLYFEEPAAVTRTWTPPAFLRRIQWWLEKSARGELHPTDQPVEHLFFSSKYELILPWNLSELRKDPTLRFVVVLAHERLDHGFTWRLVALSKEASDIPTTTHIELILPPIVQGFVERDPGTLGQLADLLSRREVDLISPLRAALQDRVGEAGLPDSADDRWTIILLRIPLARDVKAEPDRIAVRAFLLSVGALKLGVATSALFQLDKRYFKDLMIEKPSAEWRDLPLLSMGILEENDRAAARQQSGIDNEGPAGVLIGAGALGSALLSLWGRGGWGCWTVIDNDHIKPHNLSRHSAYAQHIGEHKVTAVAGLHAAVMRGASEIVPIVGDACDFNEETISRTLNAAALIVDASTMLEYPRAASAVDALPRHISAFIAPNGNSAVLLAEDAKRLLRLRTLEAQYYRAIIQADWGKKHLTSHTSTFWSGSGCRDISVVMPYSRILGHASTLAEQIQVAAACEDALMRIWQRDPVRGTIEVHDVSILPERRFPLGKFDLFIDYGVEEQLRALRQQGFPAETGGVLLGYYDFNINAIIVVAGLPAPPDSKASTFYFERGIAGLTDAIMDAAARTMGIVSYIGEWHSHPPGHSASPSKRDLVQLIHLALGMADDGLPAVQLIVGEHDIQVIQGSVK